MSATKATKGFNEAFAIPAKKQEAELVEAKPVKRRKTFAVRLPLAEWLRVKELASKEETSVQALAIEGLSKVFEARGLPGLKG